MEVKVKGAPAEGYSLLDPVVTPDIVTLSGSDFSFGSVETVYVTADLEGLSENYNKNLAVEVLNSSGENITDHFTCYPSSVNVLVPVVLDQPDVSLPVRCAVTGQPATGFKVSRVVVDPSTVLAFGPQEVLDSIMSLEAESVSVEGLDSTTSFTSDILVPAGVSLSREQVTVVVQIEAINSAVFSCPLNDFRSAPSDLDWTCSVSSCSVSLNGTDTNLQTLTADDITVYVDLSSVKEAGEYELPVLLELPAGVTLAAVEPATVVIRAGAREGEEKP